MKCQSFLVLIFAKFGQWFSYASQPITIETFQSHWCNMRELALKCYYVFKILLCGSESKATQRETRASKQRPPDLTYFIGTFHNTCFGF